MWNTHKTAREIKAQVDLFTADLLQETSRFLTLVVSGSLVLIYLFVILTWPQVIDAPRFFLFILLIAITGTVFLFLPRWPIPALMGWLICLAILLAGAIDLFRFPGLGVLFIIFPLMGAVIIGWTAGALMTVVVGFLVLLLANRGILPPFLSADNMAILLGSMISGLTGWAGTRSFLTVSRWALHYSEQARQALDEARKNQLEMAQIQEDLLKANQELVRLSNRQRALQQEAEEARQAKAEFVANVSHEFRAPLNMIIGFSELITQSPKIYGTKLPSALLADISTIRKSSLHLAKLIDDVLDLSQVEAGRMAINKEKCSVYEIMEMALPSVKKLFESKGLYLETDLPNNLPLINCDRTRVCQILINLLSNSGRFTEKGGVKVRVSTNDGYIVFSIYDTGPGIALEDQEKLFQPFQQLDSTIRRKHGGSGLGLSICKRFVEMHDGKIWLESRLNEGTMISFQLPMEPVVPTNAVSNVRRWINPYALVGGRSHPYKAPEIRVNPRFVLMEPGNSLLRILKRYMGDVEIANVHTSEEALQELNRSPAQALIINSATNMQPVHQGQLDELPFETPSITCWVPGLDDAANQLGVVDYLMKPVTPERLLSRLSELGSCIKTVLIVEDDQDLMKLYVRILSSGESRYRLLRAKTGQEALDSLREKKPDLVILDLILPIKDGFQVLQEKKADPSIDSIPVIIVSSRDPVYETSVTNQLMVSCKRGLSALDLIDFIQAVSQILAPSLKRDDQVQPKTSPV